MAMLGEAFVRVRPDTKGFEREAEGPISGAGKKLGGLLAAGIAAAGAAAGAGAAFGLKTAAGMEQARISFETMLGSAEKAGAFLRDLQQFAASTPFEFPELQTAASSLISAGVNAEKVLPIMKSLGDVTSGMGTGSEGVKRATVALQQMAAAGRITGEDLNQLRDAGVPVFDLLAAATGKSKEAIAQMAQSGKLGRKEMEQLFAALETGKGLERFNGLMEKQSQSLSGLFSTLKDNVNMLLADLVTPAIPAIKSAMGTLTGTVMPTVKQVATALFSGDFIGSETSGGGIFSEDSPVIAAIFRLREGFGFIADGVRVFVEALQGGEVTTVGALGRVGAAAYFLRDAFLGVVAYVQANVLPALGQIIGIVRDNLTPIMDNSASVLRDNLFPAFRVVADFVAQNVLPVIVGLVRFVVEHVIPAVQNLAANILGGLRSAFETITRKINENRPQLEALLGAFKAVAGFILDKVVPLLGSQLKTTLENLGTAIGLVIDVIGVLVGAVQTAVGWFQSARDAVSEFWGKLEEIKVPEPIKQLASIVGTIAGGLKDGAGKLAGFFGVGDGPGRAGARGGPALSRVRALLPAGLAITSTYRSPAQNRAVGGSPTSYHMDANNPAVDIAGPVRLMDAFYKVLLANGPWRELLYRTTDHFDHIHVADKGGIFKGPGYVWMGKGYETFASGTRAEKVADLPSRGMGGITIVHNGDNYAHDPQDYARQVDLRLHRALAVHGL